jgi:CRISPR/Cas system CSM-associated protein Csm5 (group 7 of RAMP superfamily)
MGSKVNPQDTLNELQEVQADLEDFELVEAGTPIDFTVGTRRFALRQPEPQEYELIRLWENIGREIALQQKDMDVLAALPVSDETRLARQERLDMLHQQIKATKDTAKRREIDEQIRRLERPDNRTRAEELAESYSYRYRDIEMIKRLLVDTDGKPFDKAELDRLLRTQVFVDMARIACFRIIKIMLSLPSWIERPASEPS